MLHARTARLTVHGPMWNQPLCCAANVCRWRNFTAGYGVWLARANFNRQSLRSLLGREGGIDRPHVYLMQPYDPNRRIIVMLHGLASSPEAWVELANEILGDEGPAPALPDLAGLLPDQHAGRVEPRHDSRGARGDADAFRPIRPSAGVVRPRAGGARAWAGSSRG